MAHSAANLPPGTYSLVANVWPGRDSEQRLESERRRGLWAEEEVQLEGSDVIGLSLLPRPAMELVGTVVVDPRLGGLSASASEMRVHLQLGALSGAGAAPGAPMPAVRTLPQARFVIDGILPGRYVLTGGVEGGTGWHVQSVRTSAGEVLDGPLTFDADAPLGPVTVVVSTLRARLEGIVRGRETSAGIADYTVLVFPADRGLWHAGSPRIAVGRPDVAGRFAFELPSGEYLLATAVRVSDAEAAEAAFLTEASTFAIRVTLRDGQTTTADVLVTPEANPLP